MFRPFSSFLLSSIGGTVWLDMPEMGAEGLAEVVSIDRVRDLPAVCARLTELGVRVTPAGDIPSVPGLVTNTFAHTSGAVSNLKLKSEAEPIGVTGTHPIWSADQHDWVAAADLKPGERVRTGPGVTIVESITKRYEPEPVYNIEVDGDHVYRVGETELLVKNTSPKPKGTFKCPFSPKDDDKAACVDEKVATNQTKYCQQKGFKLHSKNAPGATGEV